jgi:hypothetical protein
MGQNPLFHFLVFSSLLAHVCYVFTTFGLVLYDSWQYNLCNKDHQQAPPHLVLCLSSSKGMKD